MSRALEQDWLLEARGGQVREFYAVLGIELPAAATGNAQVRCFANVMAHSHDDRVPSCSVNLATGLWKCHGCGDSGNAYRAAELRGYRAREAADLARQYGLFAERDRPALMVRRGQLQRWHGALVRNRRLLNRLYELRGWTSAAVRGLRLGFDGERIVFPIRDAKAKLVGVVRYQPNPDCRDQAPKTLALPGSRRELFPAPEKIPARCPIILVEGEPDAVAVWSAGHPACGIPGTGSWRPEWARRLFERHVIVLCDCDSQGRQLAQRIKHDVPFASVVDLDPARDDGYDIGDFVREAACQGGYGQVRRVLGRLASWKHGGALAA